MVRVAAEGELAEATRLTMKALKEYFGLSHGAYSSMLRRVGAELAHAFSKTLTVNDLESVVGETVRFWNTHGLGEMWISAKDPLMLEIRNCYDCIGNRYGVGETLCAFKEGFVKAVLDDRLGSDSVVEEKECCGTFAPTCKFRVTGLKHAERSG